MKAEFEHVRHVLEGWARWRCGRHGIGWSPISLTGKLLNGMPGTNCPTCGTKGRVKGEQFGVDDEWITCPTCSGKGRVPMELSPDAVRTRKCPRCVKGEINGRTCFKCNGTGRYVVPNSVKVNPALIPPTRKTDTVNPTFELVDRTIAAFRRNPGTLKYYFVVLQEYTRPGRQSDKARRMRISPRTYKRYLMDVHIRVDDALKRD